MEFIAIFFIYILLLFVLVFFLLGCIYLFTIFGEMIGVMLISYLYKTRDQKKILRYSSYLKYILITLFVLMITFLFKIVVLVFNDEYQFWSFFYFIISLTLFLVVIQMRTKIDKYKQSKNVPSISAASLFKERIGQVIHKLKLMMSKYQYHIQYLKKYIKHTVKSLLNSQTVTVTIYIILINYVLLHFLVNVGFSKYDELGSYLAILLVVPFSMVFWIYFNNKDKEMKNLRRIIMYIVAFLFTMFLSIAKVGKSGVLPELSDFIIFLFTVAFVFGEQITNLTMNHYLTYKDKITDFEDK